VSAALQLKDAAPVFLMGFPLILLVSATFGATAKPGRRALAAVVLLLVGMTVLSAVFMIFALTGRCC
jgi:hypothetical protein